MELKKIIRLFTPIILEGVLSARRHSRDRLVEKLHELQFMTRNVRATQSGEAEIELQILDVELLFHLLAGEANKFFLASMVSLDRAMQGQNNNASWQAIEHYYSAYYAVHYLLRLTGVSLTNLDSQGAKAIGRSYYGGSGIPPSGLYVMRYDSSTETLTLKKSPKKGGSHKEAWQLWAELVDKLRFETNSDPVEYARTSLDLTEHRNFLVKSTDQYSPPEIRGEINYQFKGSTWIFEPKAKDKIDRLQRSILSTQLFSSILDRTPEGLVSNNKIIIEIANAVFLHAAQRYPKGICRSLANKYPEYIATNRKGTASF